MMKYTQSQNESEIKVRFKNVGQGDTIIIEWIKDNLLHVGIIDCIEDDENNNPVVAYLTMLNEYKCIEFKLSFIILSHPHRDHCYGIVNILQYLIEKKIKVESFCNTFYQHPEFIPELPEIATKLLPRILDSVTRLYEKGLLKEAFFINKKSNWELNDFIRLRCLSPSHFELVEYSRLISREVKNESQQRSKAANWLSTLIKIESRNKHILFTSDSELAVFDRILSHEIEEIENNQLCLMQVPHHGSWHNFKEIFWKKIKRKDNCAAVISVGNDDPKHPDGRCLEVLMSKDFNYNVKCTNEITKNTVVLTKKALATQRALDDDSFLIDSGQNELAYLIPL